MCARQASDLHSSLFYFSFFFMVLIWAILVNINHQGANTQFELGILFSRSKTRYGEVSSCAARPSQGHQVLCLLQLP